jgi:ribonucleoside-diphosphate reductase alpha chain
MTRQRLPNRRAALAFEFAHLQQRYRAQVGFFGDGRPAELFLNSSKIDTAIDAFAADAAILISLLLQHGATLDAIGHALRRAPDGSAASLIGAVIDAIAELP